MDTEQRPRDVGGTPAPIPDATPHDVDATSVDALVHAAPNGGADQSSC